MPSYSISISDADSDASGVLRRMRLDGLNKATVPFDERCVSAWRRGAPEPGMDVQLLINVVWVRFCLQFGHGLRTWRASCDPERSVSSLAKTKATREPKRASIAGCTHMCGFHGKLDARHGTQHRQRPVANLNLISRVFDVRHSLEPRRACSRSLSPGHT